MVKVVFRSIHNKIFFMNFFENLLKETFDCWHLLFDRIQLFIAEQYLHCVHLLVIASASACVDTLLVLGTCTSTRSSIASTTGRTWCNRRLQSNKSSYRNVRYGGNDFMSIRYIAAVHVSRLEIRDLPINPRHFSTPTKRLFLKLKHMKFTYSCTSPKELM